MKKYALFVSSSKVDVEREETAAYIDIRYFDFFEKHIPFQFTPVVVPNLSSILPSYLRLSPAFIVLTGGQDFHKGEIRYEVEQKLLEASIRLNVPTIGICRGMQRMSHFLGSELKLNENSLIAPHPVFDLQKSTSFFVNSYHKWQLPFDSNAQYSPLLVDESGNVEAFNYTPFRWLGVMWHPERFFNNNQKALEWMDGALLQLFDEQGI